MAGGGQPDRDLRLQRALFEFITKEGLEMLREAKLWVTEEGAPPQRARFGPLAGEAQGHLEVVQSSL